MDWHNKKRLTEQLKFFGHKSKRFISCYAKKPRILMTKPTVNDDLLVIGGQVFNGAAFEANRSALYQQQMQMGMQNSTMGYMQMAAMGQSQFANGGNLLANGYPSGLASGFCGLGGLGMRSGQFI